MEKFITTLKKDLRYNLDKIKYYLPLLKRSAGDFLHYYEIVKQLKNDSKDIIRAIELLESDKEHTSWKKTY